MEMFNAEHLQEKWDPILNYEGAEAIKDSHRKMVTAVLLENQEKFLREQNNFLYEASPTNSGNAAGASGAFGSGSTPAGPTAGFDPVLISLIRRSMPNLVAYDLAGVQPMNGPTGLIFAMRSRKNSQSGDETFFDEVDTAFSASDGGNDTTQGSYTAQASETNVGFGTLHQVQSMVTILEHLTHQVAIRKITQLVKVWQLETLRFLAIQMQMLSTRWHSQSRKLQLLQNPEH